MIEFIIPTYNRPDNLISILYSLISQTNNDWKAHVVIDNKSTILFDKVIELLKDEHRIKFTCINGPHNDVGHTPRNYGLENATEEWVVMTGDDNYYIPTFVNEIFNIIDEDTKFVYCDMIHNGYDYQFFNCHHSSHNIDIGNMIMKTELAKTIRLDTTRLDADGVFCGEYININCQEENKIKKINKILYVHN
jgi:glycosyltransferase involved in cell wall biosynthesis